jgi:exodeoxyribonuclease VII small subunit
VTDETTPSVAPGYTEALAELEAILVELEDGEVDIDRLAGQVRRAAELLELCRGRVEDARVEVTRIVGDIAAGDDEQPTAGRDPSSEGDPAR